MEALPVTSLYQFLYHCDHFAELTGRPQADLWSWKYAEPEAHLATYREIVRQVPFDLLQPQPTPSREERARTEFVVCGGALLRRDRSDGRLAPVAPVSGHAWDERANEVQTVFDERDARERITVTRAEDLFAAGLNDYADAVVAAFGDDRFILTGGVVGTLFSCSAYVGLTNLFALLLEQPALIAYMSGRLLERNIEVIRQLAAAGGDAIFVDDATTTSDMISVAHYERFSLPYVREMVREIQRLGQKAIVIYFGGIADRLEQIASLGAEGLSVECSMKGYVNDIAEIAAAVGDRVSLFGNVDPVGVLQDGNDGLLCREVERQVAAGRQARGFVLCTGSPITPRTPLRRVQRFLELGRSSRP